ncbi:hypothetical protein SprV_0200742200 [Sparganum proliferum]
MSRRPLLPHPPTPTVNTDRSPEPPLPSSSVTSKSAATAPAPTATAHNPDTPTNTNFPTVNTSDMDSIHTRPHCDHILISNTSLLGHLQTHRTETDEPVPGAPTYIHRIRLHYPHCPAHSLTAWAY